MTKPLEKIMQILDHGSKKEKIDMLEYLSNVNKPEIINKIISKLDDPDIEIRGEAFSTIALNNNKISHFLINSLKSESKNIRGFSALILANRNDFDSISSIIDLTKDSSSMVRSCALGALGYLKANQAWRAIHDCLHDSNLEVKKSALKAAIDIGYKISEKEISAITKEGDEELASLLVRATNI